MSAPDPIQISKRAPAVPVVFATPQIVGRLTAKIKGPVKITGIRDPQAIAEMEKNWQPSFGDVESGVTFRQAVAAAVESMDMAC